MGETLYPQYAHTGLEADGVSSGQDVSYDLTNYADFTDIHEGFRAVHQLLRQEITVPEYDLTMNGIHAGFGEARLLRDKIGYSAVEVAPLQNTEEALTELRRTITKSGGSERALTYVSVALALRGNTTATDRNETVAGTTTVQPVVANDEHVPITAQEPVTANVAEPVQGRRKTYKTNSFRWTVEQQGGGLGGVIGAIDALYLDDLSWKNRFRGKFPRIKKLYTSYRNYSRVEE